MSVAGWVSEERGAVMTAAFAAATVSGLPSTAIAIVSGGDPLAATVAAGSLLLPRETRQRRLVAAAVPVHLALSLGWTTVLARALPRRHPLSEGALAGLAIAALDLGIIGRRFERIRALPLLPQLADHAVFGATAAWALARRL